MQFRRRTLGLLIGLVGCAGTAATPSLPSPTAPLTQTTTIISPTLSGAVTPEPTASFPALDVPTETASIPSTPTATVPPMPTAAPVASEESGSLIGFVTTSAPSTDDQPRSIEVSVIGLDGSVQRRIVVPCPLVPADKSQRCDASAVVQVPNQRAIVLGVAAADYQSSLYAVDLDAGTVQILADSGAEGPILFSPDGSQMTFMQTEPITFAHPTGVSNAIWGLDWNSGERYPITLGGYWFQDMTWADNDLLYFSYPTVGTPPGGWEIHQVRMSDDLPHSKFADGMIKGVFADQSLFIIRSQHPAPAGSASQIYSLDLLDPASLKIMPLWGPDLEFANMVLMSPDRMRAVVYDSATTNLMVVEATNGIPTILLDIYLSLGCKEFSETNPCIPPTNLFWNADSQTLLYWNEKRLMQLSMAGEQQQVAEFSDSGFDPASLKPIFQP